MTIILLIFFTYLALTSKIVKNNSEYLSKDYTNIIKGAFLIWVFVSHFRGYNVALSNQWYDIIGVTLCSKIGQLMVVMFLFYSGYGIMESIKHKGKTYVNNLPKKRILPTWIHFAFAVFVFMIVSQYYVTHEFSLKEVILTYIGWGSYGNSNWYIFCIIILYFITYLSAKSFKDNKKILGSMFIGTLLYTTVMSIYKETYWYDTAFCFVLGSTFSIYRNKIEKWIENREFITFVYLIAFFIIAYHFKKYIIFNYIHTILFAMIILMITRKIEIKNTFFKWIGKNLFPMYIFQRLPMMVLNRNEFMRENPYLFFIIAFIATIGITFIYNFLLKMVNKIKEKNIKCIEN